MPENNNCEKTKSRETLECLYESGLFCMKNNEKQMELRCMQHFMIYELFEVNHRFLMLEIKEPTA